MTEPTVNIPLLRKAVEWAEAEAAKPARMSQWYQAGTATLATQIDREVDCGTCFCIAGYITALHHKVGFDNDGRPLIDDDPEKSFCATAREHLGVSHVADLFAFDNTIEDVRRIAESIAGERL